MSKTAFHNLLYYFLLLLFFFVTLNISLFKQFIFIFNNIIIFYYYFYFKLLKRQGLDPRVTFFESSHVFKQIDLESNDQVKISAVEEILL